MSRSTLLIGLLLVVVLVGSFSFPRSAQSAPGQAEDPARREAFELYNSGKYVDAMPLLEKVVADHPADLVAKEHWAFSMVGYAATLSDTIERKKARARARTIALQLKEAGDTSNLLQ